MDETNSDAINDESSMKLDILEDIELVIADSHDGIKYGEISFIIDPLEFCVSYNCDHWNSKSLESQTSQLFKRVMVK